MARRFVTLDVFTATALSGNPLAVVLDGAGLETERCQAIAREFNLSETVFVLPPEKPIHSAKIRIFTPQRELPFAGHPTVGTAVLLAEERVGRVERETDLLIVLEEGIGPVRTAVMVKPDGPSMAWIDVPQLPRIGSGVLDKEAIASALGLTNSEIGFENHRLSRYDAGMPFTFVPVRDLSVLRKLVPNGAAWKEAFGGEGANGAFVYCRETVSRQHHFHARMFAPGLGVGEDPATGSAAAAFAGVIAAFDEPRQGTHRFCLEQGYEMGRPSQILLEIDLKADAIEAVRVGGTAVRVSQGTLDL